MSQVCAGRKGALFSIDALIATVIAGALIAASSYFAGVFISSDDTFHKSAYLAANDMISALERAGAFSYDDPGLFGNASALVPEGFGLYLEVYRSDISSVLVNSSFLGGPVPAGREMVSGERKVVELDASGIKYMDAVRYWIWR